MLILYQPLGTLFLGGPWLDIYFRKKKVHYVKGTIKGCVYSDIKYNLVLGEGKVTILMTYVRSRDCPQ